MRAAASTHINDEGYEVDDEGLLTTAAQFRFWTGRSLDSFMKEWHSLPDDEQPQTEVKAEEKEEKEREEDIGGANTSSLRITMRIEGLELEG